MPEPPRYRPGYPLISDPEHPLWLAQQAGWPDHLSHEAWAIVGQDRDTRRADSSEHPAFATGYTPNYYATEEEQRREAHEHRPRSNRR